MATQRWVHMKGPSNHLLQIDSWDWCLSLIHVDLAYSSILLSPTPSLIIILLWLSVLLFHWSLVNIPYQGLHIQSGWASGSETEEKSKTRYHWLAAGTYHIQNSGNVGRKITWFAFRRLEYAYSDSWLFCQVPSNHKPTLMHRTRTVPTTGFCLRRAINTESKLTTPWLW